MTNIKVLGTGCTNCKNTITLLDEVAREKGVEVHLEKVENLQDIMRYGIMSTPGVVIDGKVVHSGGVPSRQKVEGWFEARYFSS
jgi:small redox-active disulfide protein 2